MMYFSRPYALYALIPLVPALVCTLAGLKKMKFLQRFLSGHTDAGALYRSFRRRSRAGIVCNACAWCCLVLAWSGPEWGESPVPVQTSGAAVSFVFDISYSMTATDVSPEAGTRLGAASLYAGELLSRIGHCAVSAVLVKGTGIIAVPLTEDTAAVRSVLENLSPAMMSAAGSDVGSGIAAAIRSFPPQSAGKSTVIVFTDGEETSGSLEKALDEAVKYGISVVFAGIGSEAGADVVAGDGKTVVHTALQRKKLESLAETYAGKKTAASSFFRRNAVVYADFSTPGAVAAIAGAVVSRSGKHTGQSEVSYEIRRVPRHRMCILAGMMCFAAGFVFRELHIQKIKKKTQKRRASPAAVLCIFCSVYIACTGLSCSAAANRSVAVLEGTVHWHRKEYQKATASFLRALEIRDEKADAGFDNGYALLGLAASYIMQGEHTAAVSRLADIQPDAPVSVLFAASYNSGVAHYAAGNYAAAAELFKKALQYDAASIPAKINLELSLAQKAGVARSGEQELTPVQTQENPGIAGDALFSVVRENEQNRWKNQKAEGPRDSSVIDY